MRIGLARASGCTELSVRVAVHRVLAGSGLASGLSSFPLSLVNRAYGRAACLSCTPPISTPLTAIETRCLRQTREGV